MPDIWVRIIDYSALPMSDLRRAVIAGRSPSYGPDVPFEIAKTFGGLDGCPNLPNGHPATENYCITVTDEDAASLGDKIIPDEHVPEEDKLLVRLCRTPLNGNKMRSQAIRALFGEINTGIEGNKAMAARLLAHAARRRLKRKDFDDIIADKGIAAEIAQVAADTP